MVLYISTYCSYAVCAFQETGGPPKALVVREVIPGDGEPNWTLKASFYLSDFQRACAYAEELEAMADG